MAAVAAIQRTLGPNRFVACRGGSAPSIQSRPLRVTTQPTRPWTHRAWQAAGNRVSVVWRIDTQPIVFCAASGRDRAPCRPAPTADSIPWSWKDIQGVYFRPIFSGEFGVQCGGSELKRSCSGSPPCFGNGNQRRVRVEAAGCGDLAFFWLIWLAGTVRIAILSGSHHLPLDRLA